MDWLLGLGLVLYIMAGSACAAFLLYTVYTAGSVGGVQPVPASAAAVGHDDFAKLAIAALIGVIGTGLTGLASVYGATRQAGTASQVAEFNAAISRHLAEFNVAANTALAEMKGEIDKSLAQVKSSSDESLARLKIALDASQIAYRQLFGSATVYFHTLRTIALTEWDDESLKTAQSAMVAATPHCLHVDAKMRDLWFDLWQRGQDISRAATDHAEISERPDVVRQLFDEYVKTRSGKLNFRELHLRMEEAARVAIADSGEPPAPTSI
ncbi:MAG: hypothetical protein ACR652_14015 [Methylocystis sp.]|uniref:hypothetical protein n=1 Tax=Methylocystis sp. TaxID=1911079 RepID=UPI003DA2B4EB